MTFKQVKAFLKRPGTVAFLAFTALFAVGMAVVFWGTWGITRAPIEPDNPVVYPPDAWMEFWRNLWRGGVFSPFEWRVIFGGLYFWQELEYAVPCYLASLGMAYYLRGRGLSFVARYGAALAYGFAGYGLTLFSAGHLGWFCWLASGPFAFGLVDRAVRKGTWRHWILLGGVLTWASLRQPDIWLFFTELTFCYGVYKFLRTLRKASPKGVFLKRMGLGLILTISVALLLGGLSFYGALTSTRASRENQIQEAASVKNAETSSEEARYEFCTNWSLPPEDTLEFIVPDVHGASSDPRVSPQNPYRGRIGQQITVPKGQMGRHPVTGEIVRGGAKIWMPYRQHGLYLGFLTVLFAVCGVLSLIRKRDAEVIFWVVATVVVYLCALGGFTPFYRLIYALPMGSSLRCPVKYVHLLEWCVATLAGFGIGGILEFAKRRGGACVQWALSALVVAVVVNTLDLVRVDHRYLAVQDISFQLATNDAASEIIRLGGGRYEVALQMQEGKQLFDESFCAHVPAALCAGEGPTRFYFLTSSALQRDNSWQERLKSGEWREVGRYAVSMKGGIRRATGNQANAILFMAANGAMSAAPKPPILKNQILGLLSALTGLFVLAVALRPSKRGSKIAS